MKIFGKTLSIFLAVLLIFPLTGSVSAAESSLPAGEVRELYPGVMQTSYSLPSSSTYGLQKFTMVEFDPKQSDLYFDVTCGRGAANLLTTVSQTVKNFNQNNGEGKTAIAAVNGDMWTVSYAHSRVEGSGTSFLGYSDAVVKKALSLPFGYTVYDGEIISSQNIEQETPYSGVFQSFAIADDGTPLLGCILMDINILNKTRPTKIKADGLNRLPANNALVVYTDKGPTSNYCLDDAYEVVIDFDTDYTVFHGETVTGRVTSISKPNESRSSMTENRMILTARGSRISDISGIEVGDKIELSFSVFDQMGNTAMWYTVRNAVGGHMPIIINGVSQNMADSTRYPASILGIKADGKVVMLTADGRQSGYSVGFRISMLDELCQELGIVTAFLLDGGGSATMVVDDGDGGYELANRPSDKFSDGTYGKERTVLNSVILSYGPSVEKEISATDISVTPSEISASVGETVSLQAKITPSVATNQTVTWTSANPEIAVVSQSGVVQMISAGNTTVTAQTSNHIVTSIPVTVLDNTPDPGDQPDPPEPPIYEFPFGDVAEDAWYYGAVDYAYKNNLIKGTSETTFEPDVAMTRAMFVQLAANMSGITDTEEYPQTPFTDTASDGWYKTAVAWAYSNSLVLGTSDTTFEPNTAITREQMCVFLMKYAQFMEVVPELDNTKKAFFDDDEISEWAKDAVYYCQKAGFVSGVGDNRFNPKGTASRAEVATLFTNFHKSFVQNSSGD